jgi:uncharacterized protein RhaS with RHS repeats
LHLTLFRAYDAAAGRWLNRDPIEEKGGMNLYAYASNDPIGGFDPLGLADCDVYIWDWRGIGFMGGRVGHVMVTQAGTTNVLLSQFPRRFDESARLVGTNHLFTYAQTTNTESGPPYSVFRVHLTNDVAFQNAVSDHTNRSTWHFKPSGTNQTHCTRAAYDALKAGGISLSGEDSGQVLPGTLHDLLQKLSKTTTNVSRNRVVGP